MRLKRDGTRAETRFRLSAKRTSPFKSARASVQSTAGSRGVRSGVSNAGYTTFRGSVRVLAIHYIRQFPLHFPSRASQCAIRFQTHSTFLYCSICTAGQFIHISYYKTHTHTHTKYNVQPTVTEFCSNQYLSVINDHYRKKAIYV